MGTLSTAGETARAEGGLLWASVMQTLHHITRVTGAVGPWPARPCRGWDYGTSPNTVLCCSELYCPDPSAVLYCPVLKVCVCVCVVVAGACHLHLWRT